MRFKDKLAGLRGEAGLSQDGLAERSGVPAGTIRNLEQGIRLPTWPTLLRLARALGASLGAFDGCEAEDPPTRGTGRQVPTKKGNRPKR